MEPSKHSRAEGGGVVKKRVSKLKPPTNYKEKKRVTNTTALHSSLFKLQNEESSSKDFYELTTPDIVSSCDESKVVNFPFNHSKKTANFI